MRKALIVVDYQNDFVDGALGFDINPEVEPFIISKIKEYEANGDAVYFTLDTHGEDYMDTEEGKNLPFIHCVKGTPGWDFHGEVKKMVKDHPVIEKGTFGSDILLGELADKGYDEVALVGLDGSICVSANAIVAKTALPNAHVVVFARGCDSGDKAALATAYKALRRLQVEVIE